MQSLADQITAVWTGRGLANGANGMSQTRGRAIPARDFMVVRVPSHELSDLEIQEVERAGAEAERIMSDWQEYGGTWLEDGQKTWLGVEPPPS